jgi:uncharacterized membrane protein
MKLRLFGHPVHSMLVHFPMALLGTSLFWDLIALLTKNPDWWVISFWNIALGLLMAVLAAITGIFDYLAIPKEDPSVPIATRHMFIMLTAVSTYLVSLLIRRGPSEPIGNNLMFSLALEALGFLLLSFGAWHGGELVYGFGIGQKKE